MQLSEKNILELQTLYLGRLGESLRREPAIKEGLKLMRLIEIKVIARLSEANY